MQNLVPIQFLALFGYLILRLGAGAIWLVLARRHFHQSANLKQALSFPIVSSPIAVSMIIITEFVVGSLFILGAFTQIAAVVSAIYCLKMLILRRYFSHPSFPDTITTVLLLTISLTLFITGAGVAAFDLPI
jgi:uncharacterized membrane protein YphA (DoxX/SURF4 family)